MRNEITLELKQLSIGYKPSRKETRVVAENLNATLHAGELVCLLGPNGAGKSTLMRTLAGMQKPLGGEALLDGVSLHNLPPREIARRVSVVLTERIGVGAMTAYALVALGRHPHTNWAGTLSDKDYEVIDWALQRAGASEFAGRQIGELSDGERQRVMVARALAQEPQIMILDEITAFLDLPRRVEMMHLLRQLAHESGKAVLLSTHDLDLALRSADLLWLLAKDGSLQAGLPEELALNGAFGATFFSEGMEFDDHQGAFRIQQPLLRPVLIKGEGKAALWTLRALERQGFAARIATNGETQQSDIVEITSYNGQASWLLYKSGAAQECRSLTELLDQIR